VFSVPGETEGVAPQHLKQPEQTLQPLSSRPPSSSELGPNSAGNNNNISVRSVTSNQPLPSGRASSASADRNVQLSRPLRPGGSVVNRSLMTASTGSAADHATRSLAAARCVVLAVVALATVSSISLTGWIFVFEDGKTVSLFFLVWATREYTASMGLKTVFTIHSSFACFDRSGYGYGLTTSTVECLDWLYIRWSRKIHMGSRYTLTRALHGPGLKYRKGKRAGPGRAGPCHSFWIKSITMVRKAHAGLMVLAVGIYKVLSPA